MNSQKVIVVSGGNGGIGGAIIKKYLQENCIVVVLDIKDEIEQEEFKSNPNFKYIKTDVTKVN